MAAKQAAFPADHIYGFWTARSPKQPLSRVL